jgi:hypothetical protein
LRYKIHAQLEEIVANDYNARLSGKHSKMHELPVVQSSSFGLPVSEENNLKVEL